MSDLAAVWVLVVWLMKADGTSGWMHVVVPSATLCEAQRAAMLQRTHIPDAGPVLGVSLCVKVMPEGGGRHG